MRIKILPTCRVLSCLAAVLLCTSAQAEDRPLWEVGIGVGAIRLPDYRGSDEAHTYVLPIPYFVYRGEHLKADRNGMRSSLYDGDKVDLDISVNGTVPVHSKDNAARQGMTDLKPTIEVGPTASFNLWRTDDKKNKLDLRTPLRTGFTVQNSPQNIGWVFTPSLNFDLKDVKALPGWNLGLVGALVYNDRKYNNHFYSVSAADATPTRPAYNAKGGYSGTQLTVGMTKRFPRYWVGTYIRYDSLSDAVFKDSPLVKKQNTVSAGFAIAWVVNQSGQLVKDDE